jgi:hypothetical protein
VNSGKEHITNSLNFTFNVSIVPENMDFGKNHAVHITIDNVTSEHVIDMELPEILNDRNNSLLKQYHKLLDGDNNTCLDLPARGSFPPIFWTKIPTFWLGVDSSSFKFTLIGKGISCHRNGKKVSMVMMLINLYRK